MSIYDNAQVFGPKLIDLFKNPIQAQHQRETKTPDGQGGSSVTWNTLKSVDVAILPKSGMDKVESERIENFVKTIVYAKYNDISDFQNGDRLEHDGLIYRVDANFDIAKAKSVIKFIASDGKAA